jgi:hypothetical protein
VNFHHFKTFGCYGLQPRNSVCVYPTSSTSLEYILTSLLPIVWKVNIERFTLSLTFKEIVAIYPSLLEIDFITQEYIPKYY